MASAVCRPDNHLLHYKYGLNGNHGQINYRYTHSQMYGHGGIANVDRSVKLHWEGGGGGGV